MRTPQRQAPVLVRRAASMRLISMLSDKPVGVVPDQRRQHRWRGGLLLRRQHAARSNWPWQGHRTARRTRLSRSIPERCNCATGSRSRPRSLSPARRSSVRERQGRRRRGNNGRTRIASRCRVAWRRESCHAAPDVEAARGRRSQRERRCARSMAAVERACSDFIVDVDSSSSVRSRRRRQSRRQRCDHQRRRHCPQPAGCEGRARAGACVGVARSRVAGDADHRQRCRLHTRNGHVAHRSGAEELRPCFTRTTAARASDCGPAGRRCRRSPHLAACGAASDRSTSARTTERSTRSDSTTSGTRPAADDVVSGFSRTNHVVSGFSRTTTVHVDYSPLRGVSFRASR